MPFATATLNGRGAGQRGAEGGGKIRLLDVDRMEPWIAGGQVHLLQETGVERLRLMERIVVRAGSENDVGGEVGVRTRLQSEVQLLDGHVRRHVQRGHHGAAPLREVGGAGNRAIGSLTLAAGWDSHAFHQRYGQVSDRLAGDGAQGERKVQHRGGAFRQEQRRPAAQARVMEIEDTEVAEGIQRSGYAGTLPGTNALRGDQHGPHEILGEIAGIELQAQLGVGAGRHREIEVQLAVAECDVFWTDRDGIDGFGAALGEQIGHLRPRSGAAIKAEVGAARRGMGKSDGIEHGAHGVVAAPQGTATPPPAESEGIPGLPERRC